MAIKLVNNIRGSLTAKMFIFVASVLIAICALMYSLVMVFMPYTYKSIIYSDMANELAVVKTEISDGELSEDELDDITSQYSWDIHISDEYYIAEDDTAEAEAAEAGTSLAITKSEDVDSLSVTETAYNQYGEVIVITATQSLALVDQATDVLIKILPYVLTGILIFSTGAAFFVSRYMTKPIRKISGTACKMAEHDLSARCATGRTDEIGILSESLNDMALNLDTAMRDLRDANEKLQRDIELERSREQQRRDFFSAVSHELKTPITILKGELEGMIYGVGIYRDKDKYLRHSLETTESMENLVREILTISKMEDDSFRLRQEHISLAGLVSEILDKYHIPAKEKNLEIRLTLDPSASCIGDKRLLEKAVSNIVGNAVAYSPQGESILVELGSERDKAVLSVENKGAGIAEEDMLRLFEPFYRVDKSRSRHFGGSGLGLYIVKIILSLHGFSYTMENTSEGVIFKIIFDSEPSGNLR